MALAAVLVGPAIADRRRLRRAKAGNSRPYTWNTPRESLAPPAAPAAIPPRPGAVADPYPARSRATITSPAEDLRAADDDRAGREFPFLVLGVVALGEKNYSKRMSPRGTPRVGRQTLVPSPRKGTKTRFDSVEKPIAADMDHLPRHIVANDRSPGGGVDV